MKLADRGALTKQPEFRSYPADFAVRSTGPTTVEVEGYASVTETPYTMYDYYGEYSEVVRAGAFAKTLGEGADVAYLANHGGLTLARTKTGTLALSEDSTGLHTVATLNTARGDARDLVTAIQDGAITEMSFAFRVIRQQWSPDYDERALVELDLNRGDVSAVNYGANPYTSVGTRAFRSARPARIARLAAQVRAGSLSDVDAATIAHVLDLVAAADVAVDRAQPLLAELIGVPNPDDEDGDEDQAARGAGLVEVLRMAEAERAHRSR
ncbi:HK97 family phage prohead protease [Nocardia sp. NPDC046763]|uniref:HK97 family phage prohead protease n=1 Tax=Nocardia sp. NPDC046763 TaxID=3155256 RepID=UPI0033F60B54